MQTCQRAPNRGQTSDQVRLDVNTHPVEVEQEGSNDGQRPTGSPTHNRETQDEEELRPRSQGTTVPGDRWPAWTIKK